MTALERPKELTNLTIARFFAALAVLLYHFVRPRVSDAQPWIQNICAAGYLGVPFFFILSGFILVYVSNGRDQGAWDFYIRRFARIYPIYALAWMLFGIVFLLRSAGTSLSYRLESAAYFGGSALTLVQSWLPGSAPVWNPPAWSLSCEAFFYALFPLLLFWTRRLQTRSVAVLMIAIFIAYIPWMVLVRMLSDVPLLSGTALRTTYGDYLNEVPLANLPLFAVGMLLGHLHLSSRSMSRSPWYAAVCVGILFGLLTLPDTRYGLGFYRNVAVLPVICGLIFFLASTTQSAGPKFLVLLGQASYGTYILHMPLWELYWAVLHKPTESERGAVGIAVYFGLLLAISAVTFVYFERPVEKWIKGRFVAVPSATRESTRALGRRARFDVSSR